MTTIHAALHGAGFGLLVLLMVQVWLDYRQQHSGRWLLAFLCCVAAYFTLQLFPGQVPLSAWPLVVLGNALPAAFWLFCLAVFRDRWQPGAMHVALSAVYIAIAMSGFFLHQPSDTVPSSTALVAATFYLPQGLKVLILLLTVQLVAAGWRADLVEPRRRLRLFVLAVVALYAVAVVIAEVVLGAQAPSPWLLLFNAGCTALLTLGVALWLIRVPASERQDILGDIVQFADADRPTQDLAELRDASPDPAARAVLAALETLMRDGRLYREYGLTIGNLAQRLRLPEHRLRRLINGQLGFRNFSDFLNSYRLEEASRRLRDPAEARLPILSIALDCGYASLPPFNRAFKTRFATTPSEYRRQHLTNPHQF